MKIVPRLSCEPRFRNSSETPRQLRERARAHECGRGQARLRILIVEWIMVVCIARLWRQPASQALDHRTPFQSNNLKMALPMVPQCILHHGFISWPFYMNYPLQLTPDEFHYHRLWWQRWFRMHASYGSTCHDISCDRNNRLEFSVNFMQTACNSFVFYDKCTNQLSTVK